MGVKSVLEWYLESYAESIQDKTSLRKAMNTNTAYEGLTHPMKNNEKGQFVPDFEFRYLSEDVPTGLCFTKGVAELLQVKTPQIDKVLLWCQDKLGKKYLTASGAVDVNSID